MPRPAAAWLQAFIAALLALAALCAQAQVVRGGAAVLSDGGASIRAEPLALAWLDDTGSTTLEQVLQGGSRFAPLQPDAIHALRPGAALWLRLRLVRAEGDHQQWLLAFPNPLVDEVRVWQRDDRGRWRAEVAGDTVPVDRWPEAGRYPAFRLDLPGGQPRDIYVQVRSAIPTNVPLRLASDAAHGHQQQLEYLGLGLAFGAMLLLIAACLAQSWAYSDKAYSWYAVYAILSCICVMAYTGVASHLVWPYAGTWSDAAPGLLAFLAAGAAALFIRDLTALPARSERLGRLALACGWAALPLAPAYLLADRKLALDALSIYLLAVTALNIGVSWLAWRRRDVVGLWVLVAYIPLALAVAAAMLRLLGWLPMSFLTQYAVVIAILLEVPLLLIALSVRSRARHDAQIREQALSSQDPLTGLLAPHLFQDRLQQVVARFRRHKQDAAVVFIDLVNHDRIKAHYGQTVAEQSLLRSVIKLRRLVRDVDTVSRVGEARFGLIMEGVRSRAVVTDRAARLIAAGLIPQPNLKPDVTLQFHIAAVLLCEHGIAAADLPRELGGLLASMSSRTRRPIRFVEQQETQPAAWAGGADAAGPDTEPPASAAAAPAHPAAAGG